MFPNLDRHKTLFGYFILISLLIKLAACSDGLSQLERIQSRGVLRVAMIATPPIYFPDESQIKGYDYEIISDYANSLGVKMVVVRANTINELIRLLKQGKAHIGISGSLPNYLGSKIQASPAYDPDEWYVIGNRENILPENISGINPGKMVVANGSRPAMVLSELGKKHPSLYWLELPDSNTRQILEAVNNNTFKLSVINKDVFTYYRHLYPEIKIAFTLPEKYSSYLLTNKNDDTSLEKSINAYIESYIHSNKSKQLHNTYFRHLSVFNYIDSLYYLERIKKLLPKYEKYFINAAKKYDYDERFLAAVSYQESHWNPEARSHTGVRGLMMLTKDTAKRVGVKDRTDPEQSINGGAKYLNLLKESLPVSIKEPDRSWMALAAYNVGLGHLEDARVLTEKAGDDPNVWVDVEKHLPKLSQKKWYQQTKHGYARGHEPVQFVRRIRRYYDILRLYQQEELLEKLDTPIHYHELSISSPAI